MPALEFSSASPSIDNIVWTTASATTYETQCPELNLHLLTQEEIQEKEIQHKKECKLRNRLKRKDIFIKKGLY